MITVDQLRLTVTTSQYIAVFDAGQLIELRTPNGRNLLSGARPADPSPLELIFPHGQRLTFNSSDTTITARKLNNTTAEYHFHGWSADGVLRISVCPQTHQLLVEPSAYSSRLGALGCRWNIAGIADDLRLIAPIFQGINLEMNDALIRESFWGWPSGWEAGFAILQGKSDGFWVHVRDTAYRPKGLQVGTKAAANMIGLQADNHGPLDDKRAAGGLVWRIAPHGADWREPAGQYRDWLYSAYNLQPRVDSRCPWMSDIRLAGCWVDTNPEVLDALAEKINPQKVLLHLAHWRDFGYDENYPDFTPSEAARAYLEKADKMGFHVMPHCNSIDMDPSHPIYAMVRDFVYLDLVNKTPQGWAWRNGVLPVPTSNKALIENQSAKVMVKIHPGLSMWRSLIAEEIEEGIGNLPTDIVFIDVTLCTWNLHNALVENMTSTEGMRLLIDQIAGIGAGMVVGGEGLNEITAQGLTFAQAHLFRSHQQTIDGLERAGGTPVNAFLFNGLARTIGYSDLAGRTPQSELRMKVHHSLGAIPTFTHLKPEEIRNPNRAVKELFDIANA